MHACMHAMILCECLHAACYVGTCMLAGLLVCLHVCVCVRIVCVFVCQNIQAQGHNRRLDERLQRLNLDMLTMVRAHTHTKQNTHTTHECCRYATSQRAVCALATHNLGVCAPLLYVCAGGRWQLPGALDVRHASQAHPHACLASVLRSQACAPHEITDGVCLTMMFCVPRAVSHPRTRAVR